MRIGGGALLLSVSLAGLGMTACSGSGGTSGGDTAPATPAPYENSFDGTDPLSGWLFYDQNDPNTPPSANVSTLWKVDDTPSSMTGGSFYSSPKSLNYNNGTSYNTGANAGAAISAKVDIANSTLPVLFFRCNYKTETAGTEHDKRLVKVGYLNNNGSPQYYYEGQLSTTPGSSTAGPCAAMGTWHEHMIVLNPTWGKIRIAFFFDTGDAYNNGFPGWFVDDFKVVEATTLTPGTTSSTGGSTSTGTGTGNTSGTGTSGTTGTTSTTGGSTGTSSGGGSTTTGGTGAASGSGSGTGGGTGSSTGGSTSGVSVPLLSSNFDVANSTSGWTLGTSGVSWMADATPVSFPGGVAKSGANSLNYNDGTDYDNGQANSGTASSPTVDLSGSTAATLIFWCNFQTENVPNYDIRRLRIKSQWVSTPVLDAQLLMTNANPIVGNCSASGTWHQHTVVLDVAWGAIQLEFFFDTVDQYTNNKAGWAVDDVVVTGTQPASTSSASNSGVSSSESSTGGEVAGSTETASGSDSGGSKGGCGGSVASTPVASSMVWAILAALAILGAARIVRQ